MEEKTPVTPVPNAEEALAERERSIARREMRMRAKETLAERGLPAELADLLDYADPDAHGKSLEKAERVFRAALQSAVEERLRGEPPRTGEVPDPMSALRAVMGL